MVATIITHWHLIGYCQNFLQEKNMKLKKYKKAVLFFKKQILATAAAMDGIYLDPMINLNTAGCMMANAANEENTFVKGLTLHETSTAMLEASFWAREVYNMSRDDEDGELTSTFIAAIFKNKKDMECFELNKWDYLVIA